MTEEWDDLCSSFLVSRIFLYTTYIFLCLFDDTFDFFLGGIWNWIDTHIGQGGRIGRKNT